jgi:hypothetical protein
LVEEYTDVLLNIYQKKTQELNVVVENYYNVLLSLPFFHGFKEFSQELENEVLPLIVHFKLLIQYLKHIDKSCDNVDGIVNDYVAVCKFMTKIQ